MTYSAPSGNPANLDTLVGAFREIVAKMQQDLEGMLPCKVISYTPGPPPRVQVQPMIQLVTTSGERISRAQIASVPVFQLGGGGYLVHFPINTGDLGWILAADRDIATFLQTYEESPPDTFRRYDFSSSLFLPDCMTNYTLDSNDENNLVLQNTSGTMKITLADSTNTITIKASNIIIEDV